MPLDLDLFGPKSSSGFVSDQTRKNLKMIQISSFKGNYLPRMFQTTVRGPFILCTEQSTFAPRLPLREMDSSKMCKIKYSALCTSLTWGQTELTRGQTKGGKNACQVTSRRLKKSSSDQLCRNTIWLNMRCVHCHFFKKSGNYTFWKALYLNGLLEKWASARSCTAHTHGSLGKCISDPVCVIVGQFIQDCSLPITKQQKDLKY